MNLSSAHDVACPRCAAPVGMYCRRSLGKPMKGYHLARHQAFREAKAAANRARLDLRRRRKEAPIEEAPVLCSSCIRGHGAKLTRPCSTTGCECWCKRVKAANLCVRCQQIYPLGTSHICGRPPERIGY